MLGAEEVVLLVIPAPGVAKVGGMVRVSMLEVVVKLVVGGIPVVA